MESLPDIQQPLLLTDMADPYWNTDLNFDEDYLFRTAGTSITYLNVQEKYIKMHKKRTKRELQHTGPSADAKGSWMRVADGIINIRIENTNPGVTIVNVHVKRTEEGLKKALKMNKGEEKVKTPVKLPIKPEDISCISNSLWEFKVDLDSVHFVKEDGISKEVYNLCYSNIEKTNKFQLSTEVYVQEEINDELKERLVAHRLSQPFLLRTDPRKQEKPKTFSDSTSPESFDFSPSSNSSSGSDPSRKRRKNDNEYLEDGIFNKVTANEATIKLLTYHKTSSPGKDIAYHVKLKDPSQYGKFKEGDVVAFLETEDNDTAIELLNSENSRKAKLAGVISESYYLAGALPKENETKITDMVCVIGIVKVKTIGPVVNGEHLYAAPERSGVAIGQSNLQLFPRHSNAKPLLLGQALESKTDVAINEEVLVSSFVSVFLGIERIATAKTVSDSETKMKENFDTIVEDASRKFKCRVILLKILLLVIIGVIALALWQRYAPNTIFRRSICGQGSNGEIMTLSFSTSWQTIDVHCKGFEYAKLEAKMYKKIKRCPNSKCGNGTTLYFMNFDRCSNRGVTFGNEFIDDTPTVSGPEIIGINQKCSIQSLHYYVDGKWVNFRRRHTRSKPRVSCH